MINVEGFVVLRACSPQDDDVLVETASESDNDDVSDGDEGDHIRHLKARRQELQQRVHEQVWPLKHVLSSEEGVYKYIYI